MARTKATKAKKSKTNPIIVQPGMTVGAIAAEFDDEFLFDCFLKTHQYTELSDISSPKMIAVGRTGSGKTAILRFINRSEPKSNLIDLSDNFMRYVSNSDILRFLHDIGVDLDILFQTLWKHILLIEYIKLNFEIDEEEKGQSFFASIIDSLRSDKKKRSALEYFEEFGSQFFIDRDENIKEIVEAHERQFETEFGAEIKKARAGGNYAKRIRGGKKSEIIQRTRQIIDGSQLAKLGKVIEIMKQETNSKNRYPEKIYILIDKLDQDWVDDAVKFRLIGSLISVVPTFRGIHNLKILVSLRADVLERSLNETKRAASQREKHKDYITFIRWTQDQLYDLVSERIKHTFQRRYTNSLVEFRDVFPPTVDGRNTFEYMAERTQMRPRDFLTFVNECFEESEKNSISIRAVKRAERKYSSLRHHAICEEWESIYPSIAKLIDFANSSIVGMRFQDIAVKEVVQDLALELAASENAGRDPVCKEAEELINDMSPKKVDLFAKNIICILYRAGVIGVKIDQGEPFEFSDVSDPLIDHSMIAMNTKFQLHKMFARKFRVHEGGKQQASTT